MKTNARTARLVPAVAVTAMCLAALAAAAAQWIAQRQPAEHRAVHTQANVQRPAADAPVHVVRVPQAQPRTERML